MGKTKDADRVMIETTLAKEERRGKEDARLLEAEDRRRRRKEHMARMRRVPNTMEEAKQLLHELYKMRDEGDMDDDVRKRVWRAIQKNEERVRGMNPFWSTVGRGTHVPAHKKDEFEMRKVIVDIKKLLDMDEPVV